MPTGASQSPQHLWLGLKPAHAIVTVFTRTTTVNISRLCVQGAAPAREVLVQPARGSYCQDCDRCNSTGLHTAAVCLFRDESPRGRHCLKQQEAATAKVPHLLRQVQQQRLAYRKVQALMELHCSAGQHTRAHSRTGVTLRYAVEQSPSSGSVHTSSKCCSMASQQRASR